VEGHSCQSAMAVAPPRDGRGSPPKESRYVPGTAVQGGRDRSGPSHRRRSYGELVRPHAVPHGNAVPTRSSRIGTRAKPFRGRAVGRTGSRLTGRVRGEDVGPWASLGRQPTRRRRPPALLEQAQAGRLWRRRRRLVATL